MLIEVTYTGRDIGVTLMLARELAMFRRFAKRTDVEPIRIENAHKRIEFTWSRIDFWSGRYS